jgi:DNA-binding transcriptional regulator YiaG
VPTKDVTEEFSTLLRAKARSLTNRGGMRAESIAKELGVPYTSCRNWLYGRSSPTPWAAKTLLAKLKRITTAP